MSIQFTANPTIAQIMGLEDGRALHEQAKALENHGRLAAAEHKYLEAIRARESGFGPDHYTTATSYDSLGELYLKMEQLDKAEEYFNKALHAHKDSGLNADLAMTRDSLGRLFEMKGDLQGDPPQRPSR